MGLAGGTKKNYIIRARYALRVLRLGVGSLEVFERSLLWCSSQQRLPFAYALTLTTTVNWMAGCSEDGLLSCSQIPPRESLHDHCVDADKSNSACKRISVTLGNSYARAANSDCFSGSVASPRIISPFFGQSDRLLQVASAHSPALARRLRDSIADATRTYRSFPPPLQASRISCDRYDCWRTSAAKGLDSRATGRRGGYGSLPMDGRRSIVPMMGA